MDSIDPTVLRVTAKPIKPHRFDCCICGSPVKSDALRLLAMNETGSMIVDPAAPHTGVYALACASCLKTLNLERYTALLSRQRDKRKTELARPGNALPEVLQRFLDTCHFSPGHCVLFRDFHARFVESLPDSERGNWPRETLLQIARVDFPSRFPVGYYGPEPDLGSNLYIGNIAWEPCPPRGKPFKAVGKKLRKF
jgi:hypothetical protein